MKFVVLLATSAFLSTLASGESLPVPHYKVVVCIEHNADTQAVLPRVKEISAQIFAPARIQIEWRSLNRCAREKDPIRVHLEDRSPEKDYPGALAWAHSFAGDYICVFYDRIRAAADPRDLPSLMAYVLAHEIGHSLQGFDGHSDAGIMKANWDRKDMADIRFGTLTFSAFDLLMIERGIEVRTGRHFPAEAASAE
jgi:hypothetical protein